MDRRLQRSLLIAAISEQYVFFLQLGDGEILEVSVDPPQAYAPLPPDPSLIANETTSLCQREAARLFRFCFRPIQGERPSLILACTDGYSNAFVSRDGFLQVGTDFNNYRFDVRTHPTFLSVPHRCSHQLNERVDSQSKRAFGRASAPEAQLIDPKGAIERGNCLGFGL